MTGFESPNYTQIPNDLFDELLPELKEAEVRVLLAILRKTFGWQRKRAKISLTMLRRLTGLSKQGVINGAKGLEDRGLVTKEQTKAGNYWVVNVVDQGSQLSGLAGVNLVDPLKEKVKETPKDKDSKAQPVEVFDLPVSLNVPEFIEKWEVWLEYRRKEKRVPVTELAAARQLAMLAEHTWEQAIKIIDKSMTNQYQGLFPLNAGKVQRNRMAQNVKDLHEIRKEWSEDDTDKT